MFCSKDQDNCKAIYENASGLGGLDFTYSILESSRTHLGHVGLVLGLEWKEDGQSLTIY